MEIGIERVVGIRSDEYRVSSVLRRMRTEFDKLCEAAASAKNRFYKEIEQLNERFRMYGANAERGAELAAERQNQISSVSQEISCISSEIRDLGAKYSSLKASPDYSDDAKKHMQYSMLREMAQSKKQLNNLEAQLVAVYSRK